MGCVYLEVRYEQLLRTGCEFQPCTYILMYIAVPYSDVSFKGTRMSGVNRRASEIRQGGMGSVFDKCAN